MTVMMDGAGTRKSKRKVCVYCLGVVRLHARYASGTVSYRYPTPSTIAVVSTQQERSRHRAATELRAEWALSVNAPDCGVILSAAVGVQYNRTRTATSHGLQPDLQRRKGNASKDGIR